MGFAAHACVESESSLTTSPREYSGYYEGKITIETMKRVLLTFFTLDLNMRGNILLSTPVNTSDFNFRVTLGCMVAKGAIVITSGAMISPGGMLCGYVRMGNRT